MEMNSKEIRNVLNVMFGRLFDYNHKLLELSEDSENGPNATFNQIIDFYLTSQAQCFIKDLLMQHVGSPGMLLSARCFLEGLALKKMYTNGKISDLQVNLLRQQVFLLEYKNYQKFEDISNKFLFPKKLVFDKDTAVKYYKEALAEKFDEKHIDKLTKSNIPFLCDEHTSFKRLIGENLGDYYADLYGIYSLAVHPSTNDFYSNEEVWGTISEILCLILNEYSSLPETGVTFDSYYTLAYSNISLAYEQIINQQCEILSSISDVFYSCFQKNFVSNTLTTITLLLKETCSDKILGLSEQVKSKWKIMLDLCAAFKECYIDINASEEKFKLLAEHNRAQFFYNVKSNYPLDNAYSIYKIMYPNGADQNIFERTFHATCGYTINERGKVKTITDIVKPFIMHFKDPDAEISWDRAFLLNYVESQMLSHANGYMWFSNSGAWGDINNVIAGSDMCLQFILESILFLFKVQKLVDKTNEYKPIINIIRNSLKKLKTLFEAKTKLLQIPGVNI